MHARETALFIFFALFCTELLHAETETIKTINIYESEDYNTQKNGATGETLTIDIVETSRIVQTTVFTPPTGVSKAKAGLFYSGMIVSYSYVDSEGVDDNDTVSGVQLGYMFMNVLGAEIAYREMGMFSSTDNKKYKADAVLISAKGVLPLSLFDLFARLGYGRIEFRTNIEKNTYQKDNQYDFFGGVGVGIDAGPVNFFLEWEHFQTDPIEIDSYSLGANLYF